MTADRADAEGVFIAGADWRGRPTTFFAWLLRPPAAQDQGAGVVLVHGGGGTANLTWARSWAARGYTVIAPDTCGCLPDGPFNQHPRHPQGGPPGWGGFDQIEQEPQEQWPYHAVAIVLQARRALIEYAHCPRETIGVVGNSWGGVLSLLSVAAEGNFAWYATVYGCGFLQRDSWISTTISDLGPELAARWVALWDPASHLKNIHQPGLWINGSHDFAFYLQAWGRSTDDVVGPVWRSVQPLLHHADGDQVDPPEVAAFAAAQLGGASLYQVGAGQRHGHQLHLDLSTVSAPRRAEVLIAISSPAEQTTWSVVPGKIAAEGNHATATLPDQVHSWCWLVTDSRGLRLSGPFTHLHQS